MINRELLSLTSEIEAAINQRRPIVALESTVISHGLPQPINLKTAMRVEEIVREAGAIPATIAILKGKLCVGLDPIQLRYIAESNNLRKISIRDLPVAVELSQDGATTVASTMRIAYGAGIDVFATGGIGGVHRGSLPDVSADLPELAKTPMVVVCSGAKIVLDLPATREWLETHGITVVGYRCDEMPAFYSVRSGLPVDARADTADVVARIVLARNKLGMSGATMLTVPVPQESEVPSELLKKVLDDALLEAELANISGSKLTPFLLSQMSEKSAGATLRANIALLENNARIASEVAIAYSLLSK